MTKSKIKINYSIVLLICFLFLDILFAFNVSAHPASNMELSYDYDNQKLEVLITHNVGDPETHYIDNITIKKNGDIYKIYEYTSQPTDSSFSYTYNVNTSSGDEIEVYTHCNKGGELTKKLTVSTTSESKTEDSLTVQDIVYYSIFGIPFIVHIGIFTLLIFIATATLPLLKKWDINIHVKWHIRLAILAIILGIIHGFLGILIYL